MITRIRDVRKAKGLTLEEVAARCVPPTTAQTIGRLETGTRTVSVKWLNRLAAALDVAAADLVDLPDSASVPVVALLTLDGAAAPTRPMTLVPPPVPAGALGIRVQATLGDYRAGDELWCEQVGPDRFARALNRDIVAPRPGGRFMFGRLIEQDGDTLRILPPGAGQRQVVITRAPWIAVPVRLIRGL
ncbi:helix-turn-helix domain-containing protein [Sphingobium sufflavum]|uniref:helix-turn-helix domain-containing protein n=1 Tax=Sphingobium sufflavum TaxID=1129547 RepID=UPI001F17CDFB|nr:helix-turn-helix transcriptional regulator [Sphingobium sufflavum]MCE7798447.1 helix-turn-helix domain-containing protein [Sphingobium sufflavum]